MKRTKEQLQIDAQAILLAARAIKFASTNKHTVVTDENGNTYLKPRMTDAKTKRP